ncbi:IS21-like element helper ATPase IstB [Desulfosarcina ovata]|uniref:ATPase AAA n=1 Tax=Desulfosarcina ovata subsp. ovata TaxID=2752305 RepID=A0A5K8AA43_9BACT|nr:IS21-like element helper ATPase IstB [Desulfosarcina ovata]BBO89328.1 ATPase AAA [Desulfosarcina ovata subsp. ovata]
MTDQQLPEPPLDRNLKYLKLPFMREQHDPLAQQAAKGNWSHEDYLEKLADGEAALRKDRSTQRRIKMARFPVIKTIDAFNWTWPKKINRLQVQQLFRLQFIEQSANVIFLGGVGLGKTHLASALGYEACLKGYTVLFATAIDVINTLSAAQAAGRMKQELKKYIRPSLLILDELGFLPIDKTGADLLFQVISQRYEQGPIVITSNRAFKDWPEIFNNDSTLTSAILDRLLHHADTILIQGKSYRMKEQID